LQGIIKVSLVLGGGFWFICPHAGQALTFLLDEKSKQKNQEKNTL
jgi:hypothetical protein